MNTATNKPTLSQQALELVELFEKQIELGYVSSNVSGIDTKSAAKHCAILSLEKTVVGIKTVLSTIVSKRIDMRVAHEECRAQWMEKEQLIDVLKEMDFGGV